MCLRTPTAGKNGCEYFVLSGYWFNICIRLLSRRNNGHDISANHHLVPFITPPPPPPGPPPKLSASDWRTCGNFQHCPLHPGFTPPTTAHLFFTFGPSPGCPECICNRPRPYVSDWWCGAVIWLSRGEFGREKNKICYNNCRLRSGIGCEASKWPPRCLEMKLATGAPISSLFPRPEC